jgi:hypothetical protein
VAPPLRIPTQLRAVLFGSVAALACSGSTTEPSVDGGQADGSRLDSGRDAVTADAMATFDGGPCTIAVPKGNVCETTCYDVGEDPVAPYACQVYCAPPDGGPGNCTCNGGKPPQTDGLCSGGLNCELMGYADGGTEVLC